MKDYVQCVIQGKWKMKCMCCFHAQCIMTYGLTLVEFFHIANTSMTKE